KLDQFIPSYVMGAGAFTDLAIATHRPTKRMLAIKCIDKSAALAMPEVIVRVVSEREILAHIKHDDIVELGFVWQDSTRVYIGVDYMCGGTLQYHIKSSHDFKLREQAIRIWFAEVASALHYLHQNSIVHRDVKPENIVLDKRGHAYLTGFGLAERVTGTFLTDVVGSESYMAPELLQLRDENAMVPGYNYCVDWFALGVTLCELLTQKHPF
ncbi:kinase-like protein, partial [Fistulina hepatica ATCC 64428]